MSEWISVKDELPDLNKEVLVNIKLPSRNKVSLSYNSTLGGWQCGYGENITHWMPLPAPPKGE